MSQNWHKLYGDCLQEVIYRLRGIYTSDIQCVSLVSHSRYTDHGHINDYFESDYVRKRSKHTSSMSKKVTCIDVLIVPW